MTVCSEIHMKHINKLCVKNVEFFMLHKMTTLFRKINIEEVVGHTKGFRRGLWAYF